MNYDITQLKSIADAIALLLNPHAEVVIHDLKSETIGYIANPTSGRAPGEPSLIEPHMSASLNDTDVIGPYEKAGDRGQRISAITSVVRDRQGKATYLVCFNLDYAPLESALDALEAFIRPQVAVTRPDALFLRDWREAIKFEARAFVLQTGCSLEKLSAPHRLELVNRLYGRGLFSAKKAAEQVADMLGVSRATIYNDLAKLNKQRERQSP